VRGNWFNATLNALKAGIGMALLFAFVLGRLENFSYDVTSRSVIVGALTALITFLAIAIKSSIRRYRY
jgi:hypothetical protein